MAVRTLMTAEQFDALPLEEGRKWELLDEEPIQVSSATPQHNRILLLLAALLEAFARPRRLGAVLIETDLAISPENRLRPDLGFFSAEKWARVDLARVPVVETPDIAVEIIPASETAAAVSRKIRAYLYCGVREVWLVYAETKTVDVHLNTHLDSNGGRASQSLAEGSALTSPLIPGWRIQIADIFENL